MGPWDNLSIHEGGDRLVMGQCSERRLRRTKGKKKTMEECKCIIVISWAMGSVQSCSEQGGGRHVIKGSF